MPSTHVGSRVVVYTCTPNTEEEGKTDHWDSLASQSNLINEPQV